MELTATEIVAWGFLISLIIIGEFFLYVSKKAKEEQHKSNKA